MAELRDLAEKRGTLLHYDPRKLRVKPSLNVRDLTTPEAKASLEWLANDIAKKGVKVPLEIFMEQGVAYISSGHRRQLPGSEGGMNPFEPARAAGDALLSVWDVVEALCLICFLVGFGMVAAAVRL